jgi:hypothetical protein
MPNHHIAPVRTIKKELSPREYHPAEISRPMETGQIKLYLCAHRGVVAAFGVNRDDLN